jgi:microsomal dipeptidase-like Zn-dependent dipeptidase
MAGFGLSNDHHAIGTLMNKILIDLHCHPGMKPYGKSFETAIPGTNSTDAKKANSIWNYDPPKGGDFNFQGLGVTRFTQSSMSTLAYGKVRLICASIYSIERSFVDFNVAGIPALGTVLANFTSGLGRKRIDFARKNKDYFSDVTMEYEFYKQLHDKEVRIDNVRKKYVLVKNFADLEEQMVINEPNTDVETIYVIISIEGLHNLNCGIDYTKQPDEATIMGNLAKLKDWEHRPFYVTFAHHFYNQLCGHARTLSGFPQKLFVDQSLGLDNGFSPLGLKVMQELTKNDGKRIHIDIKHMSYTARTDYINHLKNYYHPEYLQKKYPIIASHGACNGMMHIKNPNPTPGLEETARRMFDGDINFYDNEIVDIAESGGILGLQLDERRISSKKFKEELEDKGYNDPRHYNSKMLWNNIQHIVQLLDKHNLFAWDCIAIGSDNDGMIDPIDEFWTAEDMDDLVQYTERHAYWFFNESGITLNRADNKITPAEVVNRVFHYNAFEFFRKHFK